MDDLDRPERVKFLALIDKLREIGLGTDISLPQLVVVGDQSSGKSSLLEGITGLSFPVDSDICTRFATQIILRRSPPEEASATVTIIPGTGSVGDKAATKHLESFSRSLSANEFDGAKVAEILNEASTHLGLPGIGANLKHGPAPTKRFSEDIVRIELCGPEQRHLSVVDVPGLFHNPTEYQTEDDKVIIHNLVKKYITDERTIIMAVCNATSNLANQEVFHLARGADPKGQRTVGIVTKCDIVPKDDADGPLKIALNQYEKLTHGWFAVKNRSTKDIKQGLTIEMRHENEKHFFDNTQPWSSIPRERRGVGPLKRYLGQLLSAHVKSEFPGFLEEIRSLHDQTQAQLKQLGDPRQTANQQRQFLTAIATKYQRRVDDALVGNYRALGQDPALKLRKLLRDLDDEFSSSMGTRGHTYSFVTASDHYEDEDTWEGKSGEDSDQELEIYNWIRDVYYDSRGIELPGFVSPHVLQAVFVEQSSNWKNIAEEYFNQTVDKLQDFNSKLLAVLAPEEDVLNGIKIHLQLANTGPYNVARDHLNKFISDEKENILKTTNAEFSSGLERIHMERLEARYREYKKQQAPGSESVTSLMDAFNISNTGHTIEYIHDAIKAYYSIAIERFKDNVAKSVVESDLLGPNGPLKIFTPEYVGGLSDAELSAIAAETAMTSATRTDCTARCERLKNALDMARGLGA